MVGSPDRLAENGVARSLTRPIVPDAPPPPMICTFHIDRFSKSTVLPTDGVCDAIYLDSLCRSTPCPQKSWNPTGVAVDFLQVAKAARTGGNKTRLGLAFDAHASQSLLLFSTSDERKRIVELLWKNYMVSHYAALDINIRASSSPALTDIVTAYDFNINGDSVSLKRDKPTLKADAVPRISEGLPSYLTKRKPRSRSSTMRPPCKRPRESSCEELRASPTPCLYRIVAT
ncbi:hypothetical protein HPB52_018660 [Rhipicephalus sanguineus]|uniref:Uncharacterized protein n=1 Tax=Rhipicephalus sanguineus TaxID=34632 RepID=A0A9D4PLV5_RHISA|nr:hypothetical protein HPB52_018660 [Rhipicephalus sanguineus]